MKLVVSYIYKITLLNLSNDCEIIILFNNYDTLILKKVEIKILILFTINI